MVIMISSFVVLRQIYLFIITHFVSNTAMFVGLSYPVGRAICCAVEIAYFFLRRNRKYESFSQI